MYRLKTQMTLVEHHEDELEKKRLHCAYHQFSLGYLDVLIDALADVKVVEAFQSALQLLGN